MRYHSVMSILRPNQRSIAIDEIQLFGYNGPTDKRHCLYQQLGVLLRVRGTVNGAAVEGVAEAAIPPAQRATVWKYLDYAADRFIGLRFPKRGKLASRVTKELHRIEADAGLLNGRHHVASLFTDALHNLIGKEDQSGPEFVSLAEQRKAERWPTVLAKRPASGQSRIDFMALSKVVGWCAIYPDASEPYPGPRNVYTDFAIPGASEGLRWQGNFELEALKRGLLVRHFGGKYFLVEQAGSTTPIGFGGADSSDVSVASIAVVQDKSAAKQVLRAMGLPVPEGFATVSRDLEDIERKALQLGFPLVVKPARGRQGYGVTADITSMDELHRAVARADRDGKSGDRILIERHVKGTDYRVFATEEKTLCVMKRHRAAIIGNGKHTVAELICWASAIRAGYPNLARLKFKVDQIPEILAEQGHSLDSVLPKGDSVNLAWSDSISQGGVSTECREETHPSILQAGVEAVKAMGMPYAGIDIFLEDHRLPLNEQDAYIIEVNNYPGTQGHRYPMYGTSENVWAELVELSARKSGMELEPPKEDTTVEFHIYGDVQQVGFRKWFERRAVELSLLGWIKNSQQQNEIHGYLRGPAKHVVHLLRMAYKGPRQSRVVEVFIRPASDEDDTLDPASKFHIK